MTYSIAPHNYDCPFCKIALLQRDDKGDDRREEIVFRDNEITAFISSHWWPKVHGPVLIIPNEHVENIFAISDKLLTRIALLSKRIAFAMKEAYACEGVSIRQHNLAGNQSVYHYHLQVLPRSEGDNLYQNHDQKYYVEPSIRKEYAEKLKAALKDI